MKRFEQFLDDHLAKRRPFRDIDEDALTALLGKPLFAVEQKRRGRGETGRNAAVERRYEWALLSLAGLPSKTIAYLYHTTDSERVLIAKANTVAKAFGQARAEISRVLTVRTQ